MNTDHYKKLLLAKRRELESTLRTLEQEGSGAGESEVRDNTDDAAASEAASDSLDAATLLSQTLTEVDAALGRIEDGSYGKCAACGRDIPAARLEAIPWARYCVEDQAKLDKVPLHTATL